MCVWDDGQAHKRKTVCIGQHERMCRGQRSLLLSMCALEHRRRSRMQPMCDDVMRWRSCSMHAFYATTLLSPTRNGTPSSSSSSTCVAEHAEQMSRRWRWQWRDGTVCAASRILDIRTAMTVLNLSTRLPPAIRGRPTGSLARSRFIIVIHVYSGAIKWGGLGCRRAAYPPSNPLYVHIQRLPVFGLDSLSLLCCVCAVLCCCIHVAVVACCLLVHSTITEITQHEHDERASWRRRGGH